MYLLTMNVVFGSRSPKFRQLGGIYNRSTLKLTQELVLSHAKHA